LQDRLAPHHKCRGESPDPQPRHIRCFCRPT
jgi:hypothetical protein